VTYQIETSDEFDAWLDGLRDSIAREAIATRIVRVESGLFGDHDTVGDRVSELRIHVGRGYRAYYTIRGLKIVILLCGGDKRSQKRDIRRAKEMAAALD
jgi:putative addiction module killer protein